MNEEQQKRQPNRARNSRLVKPSNSYGNTRRHGQVPGEEGYQALHGAGNAPAQPPSDKRARAVSVPETVQPSAWDNYERRRDRLYEARAHTRTEMAPRTLAQSGTRAPEGRVRYARRSLPPQHTPVPVRSGQFRRRRNFLWRILGLFAVLTILALAGTYALTGTAFRVEQVNVTGTHNDALARQIQQMGMQGQNIFLIDVTGLTARIDAQPVVASASLQKQWPNQLLVTIRERVPVLLWQTPLGTYSVDGQGVVIAPASATPGADHLLIVKDTRTYRNVGNARAARPIRPGDRLNGADIAFAAQVFSMLPRLTGIANFTLLYNDTMPPTLNDGQGSPGAAGAFDVESKAGWIAYLGGPGDPNPLYNRLVELQQILLLARQQQLNLATVDVRYGLRPVFTLK